MIIILSSNPTVWELIEQTTRNLSCVADVDSFQAEIDGIEEDFAAVKKVGESFGMVYQ